MRYHTAVVVLLCANMYALYEKCGGIQQNNAAEYIDGRLWETSRHV